MAESRRVLFRPGRVVITRTAQQSLSQASVFAGFNRHLRGDWGEVCAEDRESNDHALENQGRLLSAYTDRGGTKFWIITEWDRSATTILLPEDY